MAIADVRCISLLDAAPIIARVAEFLDASADCVEPSGDVKKAFES